LLGGNFMKRNLSDIKEEILKELTETNDLGVLIQIKAVLDSSKTDLWDELSDELKDTIRISQIQYNEGKILSNEEVLSKHKLWHTK
jgi:hypothetical protein